MAGGDAAYGVLPFENSHAGDVSEVLDLCYAHRDICVCDVYDLPVSQNLLGVPGAHLSDVKKAVSHPQELQQPGAGNTGLPKHCRRGKKRSRGGR